MEVGITRDDLALSPNYALMFVDTPARRGGQVSSGNLDSADQTGAAGPSGVRAYPQGELFGDQAVSFTAELRHPLPLPANLGSWQGAVFHDQATVGLNQAPFAPGDNDRTLAGVGTGIRWSHGSRPEPARRKSGRASPSDSRP